MRELPRNWKWSGLEELAAPGRPAVKAGPFGSALKKSTYVAKGPYKIYGQEQVIADDCSIGDYYIDEDKFESLRACAVEPGDVLISLVGSFGKLTVVPSGAQAGIINPRLLRLSLDHKHLHSGFFRHFFRSGEAQGQMALRAHGGTMGVLNASDLKALRIPLPPLPEQKRIAAILDKADEIRRKRAEAIKLTEELLRSAFLEMFGDPVTNPKGWEVTTFGALCDRYGGELQTGPFGSQLHAADYSEEGVPVTMPRDLLAGRISTEQIARVSADHVERLARHKLMPGDLVFSRRGDVARFAIAEPENTGWLCGTGCLRIRPGRAPLESSFLWTELRHPSVRTWLEGEAKGTTMLNLNTKILSRLPVRVPAVSVQKKYSLLVEMLRTPRWEGMGNIELEQLSSSLTQRAFRGEI